MNEERSRFYCSFCGKSQTEVRRLIASPRPNTMSPLKDRQTSSCYICDECVLLCMEIIAEEHAHYGGWVKRLD